jgi:hypothetical protein
MSGACRLFMYWSIHLPREYGPEPDALVHGGKTVAEASAGQESIIDS